MWPILAALPWGSSYISIKVFCIRNKLIRVDPVKQTISPRKALKIVFGRRRVNFWRGTVNIWSAYLVQDTCCTRTARGSYLSSLQVRLWERKNTCSISNWGIQTWEVVFQQIRCSDKPMVGGVLWLTSRPVSIRWRMFFTMASIFCRVNLSFNDILKQIHVYNLIK